MVSTLPMALAVAICLAFSKKEAVKAVVQVILDRVENACPFCGVPDFDKPGLKSHLEHGDCEEYNNTEVINRVF